MRFNTIARLMVAGAAIAGLTAFTAPKANADILLALTGTAPSGSNTVYTYSVTLAPLTSISSGTATFSGGGTSAAQGFTLFDFFGLTGTPTFTPSGAAPAASFAITTPSTGTQVPQGSETAALNVNAIYNSATSFVGGASGLLLGTLSATSTSGTIVNGANPFSATTTTTQTGFAATNQGSVDGPGTPASIVPEANAGLLAGLALPLVGGVAVLRRRKK